MEETVNPRPNYRLVSLSGGDLELFEQFEREFIRNTPPDWKNNLLLYTEMFKEAVALGMWPPKNRWEGIETDYRVAHYVNQSI